MWRITCSVRNVWEAPNSSVYTPSRTERRVENGVLGSCIFLFLEYQV